MKILITGAAGFVGKHLARYLYARGGYKIYLVDLEDADWSDISHYCCQYMGIKRDENFLRVSDLVKQVKPDVVIHLAALVRPKNESIQILILSRSATC